MANTEIVISAIKKLPQLKPCPFCGGEASIRNFLGDYQSFCKKCRVKGGLYSAPEYAAEDWNRRTKDD